MFYLKKLFVVILFHNVILAQSDSLVVEELYFSGVQELRTTPKKSYKNFKEALSIINDSILDKAPYSCHFLLRKALIFDHLSYDYRKKNDYANSLKTIQQSLKIKKYIGETFTLSTTYCAFGSLYLRKKDSIKAKHFFDKAMNAAKNNNNIGDIAYIFNLYAIYYNVYKNLKKGRVYTKKAFSYSDSMGNNRAKSFALNLLSREEQRNNNHKAAIRYSKYGLQINKISNDKISMELAFKTLGYSYRKLNRPKKAVYYYEKSLALVKELEFEGKLANRYLSLSNAHSDLKQHEIAFRYYRLYKRQQIKDLDVKNIREFAELDAKYTYDKQKTIDSLQFRKVKVKDSLQLVNEKEASEAKSELLKTQNKVKSQWLLFGGLGLITFFLIIYLFRAKKFTQKQKEMQEEFSQDLIRTQEKERSRLARELHDSVGQKLMLLSKVAKSISSTNAEKLASTILEEVRSISRGLHPSNLERLGITESINALVYSINENTDLFFTEEIENIDNVLSKESELHLYRIIQETLSNIVKHSEGKAVKIKANITAEKLTVLISDNGKGFDLDDKFKTMSLGLKILFERAKIMRAQINLNSNKGEGTEMTLIIPI